MTPGGDSGVTSGLISGLISGVINDLINDFINDFIVKRPSTLGPKSAGTRREPQRKCSGRRDVRISRVIDGSVRGADVISIDRRNRITGLIRELAMEYHVTGLIRDHSDPSDMTGWNVKNIETCADPLCIEALDTIRDIESVARHFPIDVSTETQTKSV